VFLTSLDVTLAYEPMAPSHSGSMQVHFQKFDLADWRLHRDADLNFRRTLEYGIKEEARWLKPAIFTLGEKCCKFTIIST
jgi:hypothetical protein